jgi:hypothetical protein
MTDSPAPDAPAAAAEAPPPPPPTPAEQLKAELIAHLLSQRDAVETQMGPLLAAEDNLVAMRARLIAIDAALTLHGYVKPS